jgi:hypothetical protein
MADAIFYVFALVVMFLTFRWMKARQRTAAVRLEPAAQADAGRLGWTYETEQTAIFEIQRWRGTTNGLSWVAETLRSGRSRRHPNQATTRVLRWYATGPLQVPGALVLLRDREDRDAPDLELPQGDGVVATLARKMAASAFDASFDIAFGEAVGRQVDEQTLRPFVDAAQSLSGGKVLVDDAVRPSALLVLQRVDAALAQSDATRTASVMLAPNGVAISAKAYVSSADELQPYVRAGVALVEALR